MPDSSPTYRDSGPPLPKPTTASTDSTAPNEQTKACVILQFERVLRIRDAHAFGPKSTFTRWLDEFSELGDEATSPPPMA